MKIKKSKVNTENDFEQILDNWLKACPEAEKKRREFAVKKIKECKEKVLKNLDLSGLKLTSLPDGIWQDIDWIRKLDISSNRLTTIPDSVINLKWLSEVNLSKNHLEIGSKSAFFRNNKIKITFEPQRLSLTQNYLNQASQTSLLRKGLEEWVNNSEHDKQKNNREEAAKRIIECKKNNSLTLDLSELNLTSLPEEIGYLTSLKSLSLNGNNLEELPKSIGKLTSLLCLFLNRNKLTNLPDSFENLDNLKVLYLDNNHFTKFPEQITELASLETLFLGGNKIKTIPESIENLHFLDWLSLSSNQLVKINESLGKISSLKHLYLGGNPLVTISDSIIKKAENAELSLSVDNYQKFKSDYLAKKPDKNIEENKEEIRPTENPNIDQIPSPTITRSRFATLIQNICAAMSGIIKPSKVTPIDSIINNESVNELTKTTDKKNSEKKVRFADDFRNGGEEKSR